MPTAERLAEGGLRFNRFHTTALCSPCRAALLNGRNHHSVGMASIHTADIGVDTGSVIVEDFGTDDMHGHFEGTIQQVLLDIAPSAHPDPTGAVNAAMRRQ